ncbi:hypothetical protein [Lacisediminihabitans profunda]|uniref:Uncharacterized protein n=1 Tax=Lacisediminihabitans profunda TaxID=2594790 RepID=A0A5C8USF0_9MICO|nr:hypothetical protein [Lacisediminihabitans profunda]TXN31475.1 hypothetical protein FVP33_08000 [Lacisediminihabitans profunda]
MNPRESGKRRARALTAVLAVAGVIGSAAMGGIALAAGPTTSASTAATSTSTGGSTASSSGSSVGSSSASSSQAQTTGS